MDQTTSDQYLVKSQVMLQRIIGILGILLPVVLILWGFAIHGWTMQDSISSYYSWRTRDWLVGTLFTIGFFLLAYRGYDDLDDAAGTVAWIFALGVALSPNSGSEVEQRLHYICAVGLFFILAFFSLCLFTQTQQSPKGWRGAASGIRGAFTGYTAPVTDQKKIRNRVYVACGLVIIFCMILAGVYGAFLKDTIISKADPVFWLESLMIWAFGFAWFVKGETVWKDKKTS